MSDAKIIRAKLRKLLKTADMDSATQRSIQKQLEEDLGIPLDEHKNLIKEEIDQFLLEEGGGGDDSDYEPGREEPAKKKQKQAIGSGEGKSSPGSRDGPPGGYILKLSDKRFVSLSNFRGTWFVNVREYYLKDGALAPSSKGVSLAAAQWRLLTEHLEALNAALGDRDESRGLDLGANKRAGPSNFRGRATLDLREFYQGEGGALKPGKKGIALTPDQWDALRQGAEQVTEKLLSKLGGAWPVATAATTAAGGRDGGAAADMPQPAAGAGVAADVARDGSAADAGKGPEGDASVALSSSRRADVSAFHGKNYLNIREYYQNEGGQWLPGKKGISLPPDQAAKLAEGAEVLSEALGRRDVAVELPLSSKRKAGISCFKGTYYVNIREYYEKDGQQLPGSKGISLPAEQWAKLREALPRFQQHLVSLAGR